MSKFHVKQTSGRRSRPHPGRRPEYASLERGSLALAMREAGRLIEKVIEGRNLSLAWEEAIARAEWSDADRGAIRDLAWSALRRFGRDDAVLRLLLTKALPDSVRAVLLVALARLESRPEQSYVIVDQAVEAIGRFAPGLKGVANGVLRNRMRRAHELLARIDEDSTPQWCHPQWWIDRVRHDHPQQWQALLHAGNTHPPMSVRINRRRSDVDQVKAQFEAAGVRAREIEPGALLLDDPMPVSQLPGFAQGWTSVQDAGAQYAATLLGARNGERVLDACSAPGGKTAHILELADVEMLALDLDPVRLTRVRSNLERLGLEAQTKVADAARPDEWWDGRPFDRILADVPCSASGVARRHPDIKWHRRDADIAGFAATQSRLLDALWQTLAPGGTMLYATCSVFDEENGAQLSAFCARHDDARRLSLHGRKEVQLLPDAEHDGFYYAALRKQG